MQNNTLNFFIDVISLIIKDYKIKNPSQFCHLIGVNPTNIGAWRRGGTPSIDIINKILSKFPDLSTDWLITGEGEMYRKKIRSFDDTNDFITYLKEELRRERALNDQLRYENGRNKQLIEDLKNRLTILPSGEDSIKIKQKYTRSVE
jgi:hypothetical protein